MELNLEELEKIEKVNNPYRYASNVYTKIIDNNLKECPKCLKECAAENILNFIKHSHVVATTDIDEAIFLNENNIPFTRKFDEDFINEFKILYNEVEEVYKQITNYPDDYSFITKSIIFNININEYLKKYSNIDKKTLYILGILYNDINILNENLEVLNSLSKEEQKIILKYIKPLSFDLVKKYVYINSVYKELYCYFNEHYIKSFKLISNLIKKNDINKIKILINYKQYLQSHYPEYNPGAPSETITYGEWVEVADEGADTEAACYPTHNVYVPRTKNIHHPASVPTYELEDLEKALIKLEKKDFQNVDLDSLITICNYLNENIINTSKAIMLNCNEKEKIDLINKVKNLVKDFNYKISNIFNQNININFNIDKITIENNNIDLETTWLALLSSLKIFVTNLLNISNKYIEDNIKILDDSLFEYQFTKFLIEKIYIEINNIIDDFKNNILNLINKENIKVLKYTL